WRVRARPSQSGARARAADARVPRGPHRRDGAADRAFTQGRWRARGDWRYTRWHYQSVHGSAAWDRGSRGAGRIAGAQTGERGRGESLMALRAKAQNPAPTGRLFAIGDIHGCPDELDTLLGAIKPASGDTIVFVGDYVDRGPSARDVIELLL